MNLARIEDPALLCGQGRFLDDLDPLPGTLTAAIVRSPVPHARITGFDASQALALPGVAAVIGPAQTAELRPFPLSVRTPMPYYAGATDRVRFVGEPVAVVVAADRYLAEDAAELVDVDYEELPAVTDTRAALAGDAPRLHPEAESNVATDRTFSFGPVEAAFAGADHVVSGDYSFPRYSSMPLECYCVVANWTETAEGPAVEAWANFHGPFSMIPVLAGSLGVPASRLRLHVPADIGGSFGIKAGIYPYVTLMALASKHAGRPVRWTEDRLEHLVASSAGADRLMRFEAAVTADGTVTALRANLVDNVGAYLRPPEPSTLYRCFGNITGAYRIPAVRIRARAVVTNKTPTGLNRGFGGQQLYFGLERLMDKVAAVTGLDPAEARRRNFIREFPYRTPTGGVYDSGDYRQAFDLALKNADYDALRAEQDAARARGEYFGIGLAAVVDPSATNIGYVGLATPAPARGRGKSGSTELVRISVDPGGVVSVLLGTVPQGQGHATVARQVVADRLGLPPEQVRPVVEMDTATTPWTITSGSYSSRFAPLLTSALAEAADQIAATIRMAGAVLLQADPAELELAGGLVRLKNDHGRAVAFRHAAGLVHWDPGSLPGPVSLYAAAAFTPPQAVAAAADDTINSSLCYGFVADVAAVRIDPRTLQVRIEKLATVHDAGTVLNRALLEGQVHGAIAHALGGACYEEMAYSGDGQPASGTFLDYLCPTSAEATFPLSSDHIQNPVAVYPAGRQGVRRGQQHVRAGGAGQRGRRRARPARHRPDQFARARQRAARTDGGGTLMALTGGEVQLKTEGSVATLTLSNGPYTVITWQMRQRMAERFAEIDADRGIRVVVISSAGKHFSSGGDIAGFMEVDPVDFTDLGHNVTAAARSPKPVIAAIDGYCFGVGLEIALSCDIRLATARSEFALPEVKLGMIPGSGGTQRLARLIGLSRAKYHVMTGSRISAAQAEDWGLVAGVCADAAALGESVAALTGTLLGYSPLSLRTAKEVLDRGVDGPLYTGIELERKAYAMLRSSADFAEGVAAFTEKRKPDFQGR